MARTVPFSSLQRLGWACALIVGLALGAWAQGEAAEAPAPTPAPTTAPEPVLEPGPPAAAPKPVPAKPLLLPELDRPPAPLVISGSLQRVNAGNVMTWNFLSTDLSKDFAALGTGTNGKDMATGDLISFGGRTFIRAVDPKGGPTQVVEVKGAFRSAFVLSIPTVNEPVPPRVCRLELAEPQLLHTVLEQLGVEAQSPLAVLGWVDMPDLQGLAIKKAPVYCEGLMGDKKDNYLETIQANDAHIVFFAVVSPVLAKQNVAAYVLTQKAYDVDPTLGQVSGSLIHAHGALVAEAPPTDFTAKPGIMRALNTVTVKDVMQVLGTSSVKRGTLMVYRITELRQ